MNNYIVLNGKRYMTVHKNWKPVVGKPATVRYTLSGETDVTYGTGTEVGWSGEISCPVTPISSAWGAIEDMRLLKTYMAPVAFVDHF